MLKVRINRNNIVTPHQNCLEMDYYVVIIDLLNAAVLFNQLGGHSPPSWLYETVELRINNCLHCELPHIFCRSLLPKFHDPIISDHCDLYFMVPLYLSIYFVNM